MNDNNGVSEEAGIYLKDESVQTLGIGSRVSECAKLVGGKRSLANLAHISESQIHRYASEKSEPTVENLVAIANAANVTIEWLATGKGVMKEQSHSTMNREIMAEVIEVVLGELEAQEKTLPPEKMAQLMLLIHDEIQESEQTEKGVDKAKVIRLIKLAS